MPYGRKTYDGSIARRGVGNPEWRNPLADKIPAKESSTTKRSKDLRNRRLKLGEGEFNEDHDKDRYLITYADLITLLLGLFIILYTVSNVDVSKYEKMMSAVGDIFGTKKQVEKLLNNNNLINNPLAINKSLRETLQELIDNNGYGDNVKLIENERGITIRILDNILFNTGQAKLNEKSQEILHKIGQVLLNVPNDIRIEGHTDNIPIKNNEYPSNWHLSVARATNTAYYLMNTEGLPPDKVSIVGYSEYKPVASNETPEGRALNRRVDIIILKE